jgi:hypothetical protein
MLPDRVQYQFWPVDVGVLQGVRAASAVRGRIAVLAVPERVHLLALRPAVAQRVPALHPFVRSVLCLPLPIQPCRELELGTALTCLD